MFKDKDKTKKPIDKKKAENTQPVWNTQTSKKMGSTKTSRSRSETPSSILSYDSDIRFTRKSSRNLKCPCCVLASLLIVLLVASVGYYLGYKYLTLEPGGEKIFRGVFRTSKNGDHEIFTSDLSDPSTQRYQTLARDYRDVISMLIKKSYLKSAFVGTDILAFDGDEDSPVIVHFNLKFHPRRRHIVASELEDILKTSTSLEPNSVRVEEGEILTALMQVSSSSTSTTTTEKAKVLKKCDLVQLPFCKHALKYNLTAYPNIFGHNDIKEVENDMISFRELVDAECFQHTFEFLCQVLQPSCRKSSPEDETFLPCRALCNDFWVGCGNRIPARLKEALNCFKFPEYSHIGPNCRTKLDCVEDFKVKGSSSRICDGMPDCPDLSDEISCPYCLPGFIHCGFGKHCIPAANRCNGVQDCPNGSDELGCLSLAPNVSINSNIRATIPNQFFSEGYVVFNEKGLTGKICVDGLNNTVDSVDSMLDTIAVSLCRSLKYKKVNEVKIKTDDDQSGGNILGRYVHIEDPTASEITFMPDACPSKQVLHVSCAEPECGIQPARGSAQGVNGLGKSAALGDWPWHTALLKEGAHVCDGTLVSDQWVLTSVSCFQGLGKAQWTARFGSVRLSGNSPWQQDRLIQGMVKSPVEGSSLVLLKLNQPIKYSDFIRPICLSSLTTKIAETSYCQSLGWSYNKDVLQRIELKEISMEKCVNMSIPNENSICSDSLYERNNCKEEELAGSSMICLLPDNKSWSLIGVSNWRISCSQPGMQRPRLYDKVSTNVDWITTTINSK